MNADEGVDVETMTKLLNVGARQFYELKRLPGTPRDISKGRYPASSWVLWRVRHLQAELERRGEPNGPESGAMLAARLRLIAAQVTRVEMENAVQRGEFLEYDAVLEAEARMISNCKMRARSIPSSVGVQLTNKTEPHIKAALTVAIDQALSELDGDPAGSAAS